VLSRIAAAVAKSVSANLLVAICHGHAIKKVFGAIHAPKCLVPNPYTFPQNYLLNVADINTVASRATADEGAINCCKYCSCRHRLL